MKTNRSSRQRRTGLVAIAAVSLALLAGCGSSPSPNGASASAGASQPGTTAAGSTYEIVPDATVTAGLAEVRQQAGKIKAAVPGNPSEAEALRKAMYTTWYTFEGTVRKNEKSLYLQMEDGLAAIKAGVEQNDPAKVDKGIKDLEEGASGYLAKHPG